MSLETKGTIKYDPDVKAGDAEYVVECKPLGICEGGCGELDSMIDDLTEKVRRAISEEFHIPPCDVVLAKYTMTCTFDVTAPVHKTLDQFDEKKVLQKAARAVMKTPNIDHCARLCHASTVVGLAGAFGSGGPGRNLASQMVRGRYEDYI